MANRLQHYTGNDRVCNTQVTKMKMLLTEETITKVYHPNGNPITDQKYDHFEKFDKEKHSQKRKKNKEKANIQWKQK